MIPKKIENKVKEHCGDNEEFFEFVMTLLKKQDEGKLKGKNRSGLIDEYLLNRKEEE